MTWFLVGVICGAWGVAWLIWKHELPRRDAEMRERFANACAELINQERMQTHKLIADAYADGWCDSLRVNVGDEELEVNAMLRQIEWSEKGRERESGNPQT